MLSKLTLANHAEPPEDIVLHEDTAASRRLVSQATGLVGIAPLRKSTRVRPQAHGSIDETKYSEGSLIAIDGEVWSTVSIEAGLEELRKLTQVCQETLDYGSALMKWTEGVSGLKLQKLVKLASDLEPVLQEAWGFIPYHVQFQSEDPRAYSQTLTEATGGTITGTGAEEEYVKAGAVAATAIAIDGTYIYYGNGKNIARMKLSGIGNEPEWIKGLSNVVTEIAVNASNVYFLTSVGIGKATIAGGTVEGSWLTTEALAGHSGSVVSIAIDSTYLYWTVHTNEQMNVGRAKLAGTSIEKAWIAVYLRGTAAPMGSRSTRRMSFGLRPAVRLRRPL